MYKENTTPPPSPYVTYVPKEKFCPVDKWSPQKESEVIFKISKTTLNINSINMDLSKNQKEFLGFNITPKRCYCNTSGVMPKHIERYLNYFVNRYDKDKTLVLYYLKILYVMNNQTMMYTEEAFIYDVKNYLLSPYMIDMVWAMVNENYSIDLQSRSFANNRALEFNNFHGKALMFACIFTNIVIPPLSHFAYVNEVAPKQKKDVLEDFILRAFEPIFTSIMVNFDVDLYSKLQETVSNSVYKSVNRTDITLWSKQSIRGETPEIHVQKSMENVIMHLIPRCTFSNNPITLISSSIDHFRKNQITDIKYEFQFNALSASKRDEEDNSSEFDRFEANLNKADESLYIQNRVAARRTMEIIEIKYGPFDEKEIDFYEKHYTINAFQKELVFLQFYAYFIDPISIQNLKIRDFIKLIIACKRKLINNKHIVLPYLLSAKVLKMVNRKQLNKQETSELQKSEKFDKILKMYPHEKATKHITELIATIFSSEFQFLEYDEPELNGKKIPIEPKIIKEEVIGFILSM